MSNSKKDRDGILDLDILINDVVKSGIDPSYFDLDTSLPRASNIIEFALSSTYLNTVLWAKQAEQAVKLFAEWCPACSDPDFISDVPVDAKMDEFRDRVMLLDKGICPKCGKNRGELFTDFPYELVSCLGQRSGKTALNGGVITPYIMHRLLMIPNPARYYGLMSNTFLYMTFVAITADQAKQTLWIAFKGSLAASPWFQEYNKALEAQEKEKGLRRGTLLKVMDTYVWYGNKRISASYEAASTARSLRGRTRLSSSIDELGWFNAKSNALQANASETYTALSNSLRTVRSAADILWDNGDYDVLSAYMLNIGSPSSQYDKIMSLLKDCTVDTRKVGFHWSSWECVTKDTLISSNFGINYINKFVSSSSGTSKTNDLFVQTQNRELIPVEYTYKSEKPVDVYDVITCKNNSITGTNKHKIKVLGEGATLIFKTIDELTTEDYAVICYNDNWTGSNVDISYASSGLYARNWRCASKQIQEPKLNATKILTEDLALVLGYLVSEGSFTAGNRVTFCNKSKEVLDDYINSALTIFKNINLLKRKGTRVLTVSFPKRKSCNEFFTRLGFEPSNALHKHIPECILKAPKNIVCNFLSGLYEGDGWPENKQKFVCYTSSSKRLIDELRNVLRLLGIPSSINYKIPSPTRIPGRKECKSNNLSYTVYISGKYAVTRFKNLIGFRSKEKQTILNNMCWKSKGCAFYEELPKSVLDTFLKLSYELKSNGTKLNTFINSAQLSSYRLGIAKTLTKSYLYNTLELIKKQTVPEYLNLIIERLYELTGDIALEKIKSIVPRETKEYVYDLTVASEHEYWSNGFISHNSSPLITRKSLRSEELTDPNAFWRDYGAIPPLANSPFIANDKTIYTCRTTAEPLFKTRHIYVEDKVGEGKFVAANLINCGKDKQTARIVTCDAGEKGNHFCIALHHIQPSDKNVVQIYLDGIVEVAPENNIEKNEVISIHFPTMFNIVMELCKNFNILVVAYDRWSSVGEIQRLRDFRVVAERYSPKWQDFVDFRNVVYSENYKMPRWEHKTLTDLDLTDHQAVAKSPYSHAAVQMATVREIGKKVTKPEYGEDDTFRATILASRYLLDEKWQKKFLRAGFGQIRRQKGDLGAVRVKSIAVGSQTTMSSNIAAARFGSYRR